ncbi:MAG: M14 family metallocarboxypeptidase [Verrucomicrobiota bacterium]
MKSLELRRRDWVSTHCVHDYKALIRRWRVVARQAGLIMRPFARVGEHSLYVLRSPVRAGENGLYVSAGIHGDEPAGPWGFLQWAEWKGRALSEVPVRFFPCLNPWGLIENRRSVSTNRDLNRLFDRPSIKPIAAWRREIAGQHFKLGVCLHEDYDGRGIYVYDLDGNNDSVSARRYLENVATVDLPVDLRPRIDGRKADRGVIFRKRIDLRRIPGMPEAVYLRLEGCAERTLTFETPSEFHLYDRVNAHQRFLETACRAFF